MTTPLISSGGGTVNVLMVNNGFLAIATRADWYDTPDTSDIRAPVMCFVIEKDGKHYLWVSPALLRL